MWKRILLGKLQHCFPKYITFPGKKRKFLPPTFFLKHKICKLNSRGALVFPERPVKISITVAALSALSLPEAGNARC
jgi:hypothetical protein